MNHQEQRHQRHRKERAEEKQQEQQEEIFADNRVRIIHPIWFVVLGSLLLLTALVTWIMATGGWFFGD